MKDMMKMKIHFKSSEHQSYSAALKEVRVFEGVPSSKDKIRGMARPSTVPPAVRSWGVSPWG